MAEMNAHSSLVIPGIRCQAHLGWGDDERRQPQAVLVALALWFDRPPAATRTDDLGDATDYVELARIVQAICAEGEHRLIEGLARRIYDALRPELSDLTALAVEVSKAHSPCAALTASPRFRFGDWQGLGERPGAVRGK